MRQQSGGYRQAAWDALRRRDYASVVELTEAIGCSPNGLRAYIRALEQRGYIERLPDGDIALTKNTGPRSPSWSTHTDDFRDWNIDPAMSAKELARIVRRSGLSRAEFVRALGLPAAETTRLRQMIEGQRPVSPRVAAAAAALAKAQ